MAPRRSTTRQGRPNNTLPCRAETVRPLGVGDLAQVFSAFSMPSRATIPARSVCCPRSHADQPSQAVPRAVLDASCRPPAPGRTPPHCPHPLRPSPPQAAGAASVRSTSGTTTTVRRARFSASALSTTAGRVLRISLPRVGSRSTHHTSPRRHRHRRWNRLAHPRCTGKPSASNPSATVLSHAAISAVSCASCSTANAA